MRFDHTQHVFFAAVLGAAINPPSPDTSAEATGKLTNKTPFKQVDNTGQDIQQAVGTRIADGTVGKEDRVIDMLDLLGCTPSVPVASAVPDDEFRELDKQARSGSFLGNISISFPSVSKMLGCGGTGYAVVR